MFKEILPKDRIGITSKNKFGSLMEVAVYNNANDIWVKFEKGNITHTSWLLFCRGNVKNVYDKSVYGVGYLGEGSYKTTINGVHTQIYNTWRGILTRCYEEKWQQKHPTYIGCTVSEEWHNFQTFAKWYENNYYEIEGEKIHLDKDILIKGNKVYSPETCVFVPNRINLLFTKSESTRGELPIGVSRQTKGTEKYVAKCSNGNGTYVKLGSYSTPEEAFIAYKELKEKLIKSVAEEYEGKVPKNLYRALINYEVAITD